MYDGIEIHAVVGEPWRVRDTRDGREKVAIPVVANDDAEPTVLVMTEEIVERLTHALMHGHLPG
jgi:hypothetical protein